MKNAEFQCASPTPMTPLAPDSIVDGAYRLVRRSRTHLACMESVAWRDARRRSCETDGRHARYRPRTRANRLRRRRRTPAMDATCGYRRGQRIVGVCIPCIKKPWSPYHHISRTSYISPCRHARYERCGCRCSFGTICRHSYQCRSPNRSRCRCAGDSRLVPVQRRPRWIHAHASASRRRAVPRMVPA